MYLVSPEVEEALGHRRQLNEGVEKSNKEIKEREDTIGTRESLRDCLGENNKYLEEQLKEKKGEVLEILKEIYDGSRGSKAYTATCKVCHKEACITYDKFYEMAKRYNTGWTRWYSYSWFLFWKWGYKTERFEFDQCPECVTQEDITRYQAMLWNSLWSFSPCSSLNISLNGGSLWAIPTSKPNLLIATKYGCITPSVKQ